MNSIKRNAPQCWRTNGAKTKNIHIHNSREWRKKQERKELILEILCAILIVGSIIPLWIIFVCFI